MRGSPSSCMDGSAGFCRGPSANRAMLRCRWGAATARLPLPQPSRARLLMLTAPWWGAIGDVVELVELLCLAILSTPREGGKNGGKILENRGETAWCNDSDA